MIGIRFDLEAADLSHLGEDARKALWPHVRDAVEDATMLLRNTIVTMIGGVGRGRLYKRGRRWHQASAPGDPPARDYGDYVQSWDHEIRESPSEIAGSVGSSMWDTRGQFLEFGTINMAPRPHVAPSIEQARPALEARLSQI